jgi:ionotropic glutamate receptor NMDA 2B
MGALANRRVDMVMTSLTVNAEREHVAYFTTPFMETGIAILVAKRTGIISPTAFLGRPYIITYTVTQKVTITAVCIVANQK